MEKRVLTDEMRAQLIGAMPFSSDSRFPFSPSEFLTKKIPTEFIPCFSLRALTRPEQLKVNRALLLHRQGITPIDANEEYLDTIRKTIMDFKNIFDVSDGKEIEFEADTSGACSSTCFVLLPMSLVMTIGSQVQRISGLIDLERMGLK